MNVRSRYILSCLVVGVLSVTILAWLGFWARWICTDALNVLMSPYDEKTQISPLGLLPPEIENDPNVTAHSEATLSQAAPGPPSHYLGLGARDYFRRLDPTSGYSHLFIWEPETDGTWLYYDRGRGLIVYSAMQKVPSPGQRDQSQRITLYGGPEGITETPEKALGRFRSPVVSPWGTYLVMYDPQQQRFFAVDFEQKTVFKGPQLEPAEGHRPIQIGVIAKRPSLFSWHVYAPQRRRDPNQPALPPRIRDRYKNQEVHPTVHLVTSLWPSPYFFVLDASGRINLLDRETLQLAGRAGTLPSPPVLFGRSRVPAEPRSLFAYEVLPILMPLDESLSQWQYRGCLAGAYNRAGNCKALAAFDSRGTLVAAEGRRATDSHEVPGGLTVVTVRFLLENIHPPALSLLSYFTAPYYRAGSSYSSIFVMPDSFVAMKGRDLRRLSVLRLIDALVIMVPSILLAIALAILVARDAQRVGFAKDTRMLWVLITIAFGLPAYITYRWTRPQATLVTCANCGKPRRPDLERCHHCNSPWNVPELDPPIWRVLDAGHTDTGGAPPTTKEVPVD